MIESPSPTPGLWENCFPWNRCLVPNRLGTNDLGDQLLISSEVQPSDLLGYYYTRWDILPLSQKILPLRFLNGRGFFCQHQHIHVKRFTQKSKIWGPNINLSISSVSCNLGWEWTTISITVSNTFIWVGPHIMHGFFNSTHPCPHFLRCLSVS